MPNPPIDSTVPKVSFWVRIKQEIIERFLTFEALRGAYGLPFYGIALYVVIFHLEYAIQAYFIARLVDHIIDSFRKLTVNRIKQAVKVEELKEKRVEINEAIQIANVDEKLATEPVGASAKAPSDPNIIENTKPFVAPVVNDELKKDVANSPTPASITKDGGSPGN